MLPIVILIFILIIRFYILVMWWSKIKPWIVLVSLTKMRFFGPITLEDMLFFSWCNLQSNRNWQNRTNTITLLVHNSRKWSIWFGKRNNPFSSVLHIINIPRNKLDWNPVLYIVIYKHLAFIFVLIYSFFIDCNIVLVFIILLGLDIDIDNQSLIFFLKENLFYFSS